MGKFRLIIEIDDENVWMNSEFSLGQALVRVGNQIISKDPSFQRMYREQIPIKDIYGNIVGHFDMGA